MILTGKVLRERAREIWGNDWQHMVSGLGGFSRITAWRWGQKKTGHSRAVKEKLLIILEEQLRRVAIWVDELREDLGMM